MSYDTATAAHLTTQFAEIQARYPDPRSALGPMLHLVQSVDGYVSPDGIELCAQSLNITPAEVSAVATFYTQFRRAPGGRYCLGVCTTSLCAIMGGDAIFEDLSGYLGVHDGETTTDGLVTLERVECNAACDYAPVVMANWEFFDSQTPASARALVDALRAGDPVAPTRGPDHLATHAQVSRTLAGFSDGMADDGPSAGAPSLAGLRVAEERGWTRPRPPKPASQPPATPTTDQGGRQRQAGAASSAGRKRRGRKGAR
jgi:NADH-quinone oxidoreductase subunit E